MKGGMGKSLKCEYEYCGAMVRDIEFEGSHGFVFQLIIKNLMLVEIVPQGRPYVPQFLGG
jgi:hypothetical protein